MRQPVAILTFLMPPLSMDLPELEIRPFPEFVCRCIFSLLNRNVKLSIKKTIQVLWLKLHGGAWLGRCPRTPFTSD